MSATQFVLLGTLLVADAGVRLVVDLAHTIHRLRGDLDWGLLESELARTRLDRRTWIALQQAVTWCGADVPPRLLEDWLGLWSEANGIPGPFKVELRPHTAGSELLGLSVLDPSGSKVAEVVFATIRDRRGASILSVRDQETTDPALRQKRLMTLLHLFLIHRYKAVSIHYVTPTDDNVKQTEGMKKLGLFDDVNVEIGDLIVAGVDSARVAA